MSETLLDRVVEYVAPERAARRQIARASLADIRKFGNSRRGAVQGRTGKGWTDERTVNGAGARTRRDLREMTGRARQTFNESAVGRSLLLTETDNVVGRRFSLQMKTTSPEFNKEAAKRFEDWLEVADITGRLTGAGLMRTSWMNPRRDGDGGFILLKIKGYARLQYVASDQITTPTTGKWDVLNTFDGVECNAAGAAKFFHIRDADEFGGLTTTPVKADDFVFIPFIDGPESVRGTTCYSTIFDKVDQLDSYTESVILAARLACIFGLIHKVRSPASATNPLGSLLNAQNEYQKAVSLENGMLRVEGTDEDTYQVQASQPMSQTPDFIRAMMRLIALPFDMPIEIAMKDLSQVNFAGGRIGLLSFYRSCRIKQDWLIARVWDRIVFWWLSIEADRQRLGFDDAFKVPFPEKYGEFELHGEEWESNDPVTEAQADLLEWNMGIRSPQQLAERRNRNWSEIQTQIRAARDESNRLGNPTPLSTYARAAAPGEFPTPAPAATVATPPAPVTVIHPA